MTLFCIGYGSFMFFMAVLAVSIWPWNSADFLFKSAMISAMLPKMLALMMAPTVIKHATKATWKVPRGRMSLPVSRSTAWYNVMKYLFASDEL